jgi:hypothetical protein
MQCPNGYLHEKEGPYALFIRMANILSFPMVFFMAASAHFPFLSGG